MAIFSHGTFIPTHPSPRLSSLPGAPASLMLTNVSNADSGLYYVEVTLRHSDGALSSQRHETTLDVIDNILVTSSLEVWMEEGASLSPNTSQWSLHLTCGRFMYGVAAPFDVIWTDPTGLQLPSSSYSNGSFHLLLPPPVTLGNYTCSVPRYVSTCSHSVAPPELQGSVEVGGVAARLALLEGRQGTLSRENQELTQHVDTALREHGLLEDRIHALEKAQAVLTNDSQTYQTQIDQLQSQTKATDTAMAQLSQRIQQLESTSSLPNTTSPSTAVHNTLQSLQDVTQQCRQQTQQLQHNNTDLGLTNHQLLLNTQALSQQLNDTERRHSAQLTSLEAWVQQLDSRCSALNSTADRLQRELEQNYQDDADVIARVDDLEKLVNASQVACYQAGGQHQDHGHLTHKVTMVENLVKAISSRQDNSDVSFHVRMTKHNSSRNTMGPDDTTPPPDSPVLLREEVDNRGHGFDKANGSFSAPYTATYLFLASLAAGTKGDYAQMYLMWNERAVDFVQAFGASNFTSGSVHAVLHLQQGDRVWLKTGHGHSVFNASSTAFSGALIWKDP
ncbi:uncharacterized protein LOC143281361 [Babylonia areolata]|uniref:uncharacterized protein LOC143281359 n=1 Tax=Babylonia areolata TaxID=304850 RepID=UPI003FD20338